MVMRYAHHHPDSLHAGAEVLDRLRLEPSTIGGGNERGDRETHWNVLRQAGIESATYRFEDSRSGLIARTVGMPKFYRDAC